MTDSFGKHRVIGIRHTLRQLKNAGLIEEETLHATDAVSDLQDEILSVAKNWYEAGSRRGAIEIIEEILNGNLEVRVNADGSKEVVANTEKVSWERCLTVTVGNIKKTVKTKKYKLNYKKDLGFK